MSLEDRIAVVASAGRARLASGDDLDGVIAFFQAEGLSIILTIRAAVLAFGLSLRDARDLVETGPAFNDGYEIHAEYHRELVTRLRRIIDITPAKNATTTVAQEPT